jgi:CRP-like cAMP-binding protein
MLESQELRGREELLDRMKKIPFLAQFEFEHLRHVIFSSKIRQYDVGDVVIQEESKDRWLYIVLSGSASVQKQGKEVAVIETPGQIFGELAIMGDEPRSASVLAKTKLYCMALNMAFVDKLNDYERQCILFVIYRLMVEVLGERLRTTTEALVAARYELDVLKGTL